MSSNYKQAPLEDVLKMFPPFSHTPLDKKVERCSKCGKAFRLVSVEDVVYKICGCQKVEAGIK